MFAQQFDHSFNDIFNQYVDVDSASADGNKDVSFPSGDLDHLFPIDSLSSDCGDLSPSAPTSKRPRQSSPQPWGGQDFWGLPQDAASSSAEQGGFPFNDTVHPSAVSDFSLNLDAQPSSSSQPAVTQGLLSTSLSTPPQTPHKKVCTGSGILTPKSTTPRHRHQHHRTSNDRRDVLRKQSFSPSLMRASHHPQKGKMAYPEAPAQRFQNFNLRNSDDHLPLSPPPSEILVQQENLCADNAAHMNRSSDRFARDSTEMPQQYDPNIFNQSPAMSMPSPSANALARQQQRYINQPNNTGLTATASPPSADDIFSSPPSSGSQSMSSWYSDSLNTSALSFTPDLNSHDAQAWWSPMASRVAQRHPSYQQMMASPAPPQPQRPIQNSEQQNDMMQGGLMIQFDPSFDMTTPTEQTFPSSTMSSSAPTTTQETQSYHPPVPSTPQKFMNHSFSTPHIQNQPSRSPSLSPKTAAGQTTPSPKNRPTTGRTGTILKTPHRRSYERKMSAPSTTPKPVKGPSASSSSSLKSNKSVTVSFVNYTPSDSKRILTGVAPSGSSKTKARREQEARDRRRKLSEAALKAVRNAGGDVDSLEAVLC